MQLTVLELIMQLAATGTVHLANLIDLMEEASTLLSLSVVCRCKWRSALQARGHRLAVIASRSAAVGMRVFIEQSRRELARLQFDGTMPFRANMRASVRELAVQRYVVSQLNRIPRLQEEIQRMTEAAESVYQESDSESDSDA